VSQAGTIRKRQQVLLKTRRFEKKTVDINKNTNGFIESNIR
jgi:hypothetical protein